MKNLSKLPKVEMHLHIEGTLTPKMVVKKAREKNINIKYNDYKLMEKSYDFKSLAEFLERYYENMQVLQTKNDFFDLAYEHFEKLSEQNVRYAEVFFDPQAHLKRNVALKDCIEGLCEAILKANQSLNLDAKIIMCFLKDESIDSALKILDLAKPFVDDKKIIAIGFDSNESDNWVQKFLPVVNKAKEMGLKIIAHSAENFSDHDVIDVINHLEPTRIDHGLFIYNNKKAIELIKEKNIHLTLCPMSNIFTKAWKNIKDYPIIEFLKNDVSFSLNSDDPAYFGPSTLNQNYELIQKTFNLTKEQWQKIMCNSIDATFLDDDQKQNYKDEVIDFIKKQ
ncbi:adenine deaminase [Spiroplasma gladiatoris]|uniref:Adenine deaminase n=1 Tax=Spiroplasma gladiatoris TaxID=2143 RepID=A0A4P7AHL7_9MOLU|nr:adenosine deaminase [Spiroplasma gladiatoris]QBQ07925.1 adenine deaminase [Spiroplasma gladiatoris]